MQSLQNIYIPIQSFLSENISSISIKSLSVESFPIVAPITITTTLTILVSEVTLRLFSALKCGNKVSQGASLLAGIATIVILSPTLPIGLGSGFLFVVYKVYCLSKKPAAPPAPAPPPLAAVPEPDVKQQLAQQRIAQLETELNTARAQMELEKKHEIDQLKSRYDDLIEQQAKKREADFATHLKEFVEKTMLGKLEELAQKDKIINELELQLQIQRKLASQVPKKSKELNEKLTQANEALKKEKQQLKQQNKELENMLVSCRQELEKLQKASQSSQAQPVSNP